MNGNHISMYANENVTPKISRDDFFFPEIFIGNWAVHYFMHEILVHKIFFYKFSFSFMEISFSCIEVSFPCMEISFQFVHAWNLCYVILYGIRLCVQPRYKWLVVTF